MASTRLKTTKDGKEYYEIRVRLGRGKPELSTQWYIPDHWSKKAIEKELAKQAAEFERKCAAGEILTRAEQKAKEEAERAAAEAAAKAAEEEAAKIKTFKQYGEQVFMPAKTITCSENTRRYYQNALDRHLYPKFGEVKLPEITSAMLQAFFLEQQSSKYSHSTVIGNYVTCKQLLTMAYMDESIDRNPMDRVKRPKEKKDERKQEVEACTAEELKQIIKALDNEPLKWQAFIRLLIDTGIRRGEACALRWENVDFDSCTVRICENLQYTAQAGVYLAAPKTGQVRDVYFSKNVMKILQALKAEQEADTKRRKERLEKEGKPLDLAKVAPCEYVFQEKGYNKPMHPQAPDHYFRQFRKKYGFDVIGLHPHMMRHSFASVAITQGADIASVSEVLGHADKATTLRMYTHADEQSKRRAAGIVLQAIGQE